MVDLPKPPLRRFTLNSPQGNWGLTAHELELDEFALVLSLSKNNFPRELINLTLTNIESIRSLISINSKSLDSKIEQNIFYQIFSNVSSNKKNKPLDPQNLISIFSNTFRREIFTGHILAMNFPFYFSISNKSLKSTVNKKNKENFQLYENVVIDTSQVYLELNLWAEPSAAQILSLIEGVPPATIRNRLRLARERGILDSPGSGKRLIN
jgi:hypothetical protein